MGPVIMCHVCKSSQNGVRDYFKKQKNLQGSKTKQKNYRDQNLNGLYLQGRVQYLSLNKINRRKALQIFFLFLPHKKLIMKLVIMK